MLTFTPLKRRRYANPWPHSASCIIIKHGMKHEYKINHFLLTHLLPQPVHGIFWISYCKAPAPTLLTSCFLSVGSLTFVTCLNYAPFTKTSDTNDRQLFSYSHTNWDHVGEYVLLSSYDRWLSASNHHPCDNHFVSPLWLVTYIHIDYQPWEN